MSQIDDYVKHIFRKHSREDDYNREFVRKKGRMEKRYVGIETVAKKNRCGCGVAIRGVDKDKWITTRKSAVSLQTCTAMIADLFGASVLTGMLDLLLDKTLRGQYVQVH